MSVSRPVLTLEEVIEMRQNEAMRRLMPERCPYCQFWTIYTIFGEPSAPWGWREEQPRVPWSPNRIYKYCTNPACKHLGMLEVVRDAQSD